MERRNEARENAQRLVMALGKEETIYYGYWSFFAGINNKNKKEIRIASLNRAVAEYEDQNYHDIAQAIYQLIKVTR